MAAVGSYLSFRGPVVGPFFHLPSGAPLLKSAFVEFVRVALLAASYSCARYASHSFRIGAATEAARIGVEDSVIKALG